MENLLFLGVPILKHIRVCCVVVHISLGSHTCDKFSLVLLEETFFIYKLIKFYVFLRTDMELQLIIIINRALSFLSGDLSLSRKDGQLLYPCIQSMSMGI